MALQPSVPARIVDRRPRVPPVRALSAAATDHAAMAQIAIDTLTMLQSRTSVDVHERGQDCAAVVSKTRVGSIRRVHGIDGYRSAEKHREWLTMSEAAAKLGVSHHQIRLRSDVE